MKKLVYRGAEHEEGGFEKNVDYIYTTDDPRYARYFGKVMHKYQATMNKPLDLSSIPSRKKLTADEFRALAEKYGFDPGSWRKENMTFIPPGIKWNVWQFFHNGNLKDELVAAGYDGIIWNEHVTSDYKHRDKEGIRDARAYIVFEPSQLKPVADESQLPTELLKGIGQLLEDEEPFRTEEQQKLEDAWIGGVADLGNKEAAIAIQNTPHYSEYQQALADELRRQYGNEFRVWRSTTQAEVDEWNAGADIGPVATTTQKNRAMRWGGLAAVKKKNRVVVTFMARPEMAVIRGSEAEAEVVIDGNQVSANELELVPMEESVTEAKGKLEPPSREEESVANMVNDIRRLVEAWVIGNKKVSEELLTEVSVRDTLVQAGKAQKLVTFTYRKQDGSVVKRTVEPYEIRGNTFWGWDVTDDHIKRFIIWNIRDPKVTKDEFDPRFDIKMTKAGGVVSHLELAVNALAGVLAEGDLRAIRGINMELRRVL